MASMSDNDGAAATPEQAMSVAREVTGETPVSAERMTFGHNSVTYDVTLAGGGAVIVRTHARPETFTATEHNLSVLAALGLPVPRVLASDLSRARHPFAYLMLEKIPGRDLRFELPTMSRAQMTRVAEQIVEFQSRAATLPPGDGFGYVRIGARGPFPTWKALLEHEVGPDVPPRGPDFLAPFDARIARAAASLDAYLSAVRPTCFLDDLTTKNVIIERGELRGVIDFDVVCYGDPLLQIGLTATAIVCDVGTEHLFYADELRRLSDLTPDQERAADLYSAQMTAAFVRQYHATETPEWRAQMLTTLDAWLSRSGF
jgi:aminoglycoside phosphotransferase (APT) family kinase protein